MFYFVWDSSLETGIDIIDTQHRQIVDYINRLHDAIAENDRAIIHEVLDQVVNYTLTHFAFEEKMIERAGYRHCEAHKEVHRVFTERVQHYRVRLAHGEDVAKKLLSDLRIWLTNHIRNEDRDFAPVVREHLQRGSAEDQGWLARTLSRMFSR
ncbi:MAG: bacteriohemerythrin [Pseudomonadota bacterium]